jgi:ribosomal protein S9
LVVLKNLSLDAGAGRRALHDINCRTHGGGVTSQLKAYALEIFSPGGLGSTFSFSLPLSAV